MSGTHSTTMAEERLFPSVLNHKSSLHRITTKTSAETGERRISSEAVGDGPGLVEPRGAFEVPRAKRLLQVALAVVYCLLAAGIVFGYAALKPVLVREGVYRDRCSAEELLEGVRVCYQQELRLNFMFTVAAVATNVCALLVGTILDQYGPRVAGVIGSALFAAGCAGMAFSKEIHIVDRECPRPTTWQWWWWWWWRRRWSEANGRSLSRRVPAHGCRRPLHLHPELPPRQRLPTPVGPDPVDAHRRVRLQLGRLPVLPHALRAAGRNLAQAMVPRLPGSPRLHPASAALRHAELEL